jgi:protein-disulfide isomerase
MRTASSPVARLIAIGLAAIVAVVLAVVLIGPEEDQPREAAQVSNPLRGIPQKGIALGDPSAPVTMVEFADLQCPFCAEYHEQALPAIIDRYVRAGRLRLELNLLRFIGEDSDRLARTAAGAAAKGRLWQVAGLAFERQGAENSGYADDAFLDGLVRDAGLERVDAGLAAEDIVAAAEARAARLGVDSTPSFFVGPTGGRLRPFQPSTLAAEPFLARIQAELER